MRDVVRIINPYDAGKFPEDLKAARVIQLGSNENPYEPSEEVRKAYIDAFSRINRYPHPYYGKLKEKIAEYVGCSVENVAVGCGASELISCICQCLIDELDVVAIPIPGYTLYAIYSMLRNASLQFPYFKNYELRGDVIAELKPKLTFICSPNNPTGNIVERDVVEEIAEASQYVVLDEAYVEFADESLTDLALEYDNVIILRSFSKFFGLAGLRVGYAIASKEIVEGLEKIRTPFSLSQPAVACAIAAIESLEYYRKLREKIVVERERLERELRKFEWLRVYPSKANFVLVKVLRDGVAEKLERKGIIVRNVTGLLGLEGEHIRITVGTPEENDELLKALREISR